jgi:hypothetical protein
MARISKSMEETAFLTAALEGLELQKARIEAQLAQVRAMLGGKKAKTPEAVAAPAKRRQLSPAARKRIAAAQKRRWAEYRKKQSGAAK